MVWFLSVLYVLGFALPLTGILSLFRDYKSGFDRKARYHLAQKKAALEKTERLKAIQQELAAVEDPTELQRLHADETGIHDWEQERLRALTTDFPTYASVQEQVENDHFGTGGPKLKNAKRDVLFVGGGVVASTIASIWSLWL